MRPLSSACIGFVAFCCLASATTAASPLVVVVSDPLAAPLSCPCVEGYAQRDYAVLAERLKAILGRQVRLGFGESLATGLTKAGAKAPDLVIGKDSVVRSQAEELGHKLEAVLRLSDLRGKTTQTGLIVVRSDDPAQNVADLSGYRVFYGKPEAEEKFSAPRSLLEAAGIDVVAAAEADITVTCSDGACKIIELGQDQRSAAVISSYAKPLLEGCGTINKGDLRIVGETAPAPFITAFVAKEMSDENRAALVDALLSFTAEPKTLKALESMLGFVPLEEEAAASAPAKTETTRPAPSPEDNAAWPDFRGPRRDGSAAWLPSRLPTAPQFIWRTPLRRSGLGGVAVVDGLVVIGDRDLSNRLDEWRAYDATTGDVRWRVRYPAPGRLDYDNAPRATPVLVDGRAYLLGAFGVLSCVELSTGDLVWRRDLRREFGADGRLPWGLCSTPLVADGRVYTNPGADAAAWVALDDSTGADLWVSAGVGQGHASPVLAELGGVQQLVVYDSKSLMGMSPDTGERIWTSTPPHQGDFNVPTPLVIGGRLMVVTENNASRLFEFDNRGRLHAEPIGADPSLACDTSSPVAWRERVFCVWRGLYCLEAGKDGVRELWVGDDDALPEMGAAIVGPTEDGGARLLIVGLNGELVLVDAEADEYRVVSRLPLLGPASGGAALLCHPALVRDRLYLRTDDELVCVALSTKEAS
jgi:outer membrane protein assembly factor BamB